MSHEYEIDLEHERVQLDGTWFTRADLSARITQMIAAGDFRVGRLGGALEALDQSVAGAKTITFRLSAEAFARLEAAGARLGKSANVFARDMLSQVLSGAAPVAAAPAAAAAPIPTPVELPRKIKAVVAEAAKAVVESLEEPAALTVPKKREPAAASAPAAPAPAAPVPAAVVEGSPSVVVDLSASGPEPKGKEASADRKWFQKTDR